MIDEAVLGLRSSLRIGYAALSDMGEQSENKVPDKSP